MQKDLPEIHREEYYGSESNAMVYKENIYLNENTPISVKARKWVFAEFTYDAGCVRAWIPADRITAKQQYPKVLLFSMTRQLVSLQNFPA